MRIDHIGYAVKDIDKAKESFHELGFAFGETIDDRDRNIQLCFGENDGYRIELVSNLDREKKSPVDLYLKKVGPTAYHICYISDDLDEDVKKLSAWGSTVIVAPAPAIAFDNRRVVFLMNKDVGLMEIVEE